MPTITVTEDRQLHVPVDEIDDLDIQPGQKFAVMSHNGHIQLVPVPTAESLRGRFPHLDTTEREPDRL